MKKYFSKLVMVLVPCLMSLSLFGANTKSLRPDAVIKNAIALLEAKQYKKYILTYVSHELETKSVKNPSPELNAFVQKFEKERAIKTLNKLKTIPGKISKVAYKPQDRKKGRIRLVKHDGKWLIDLRRYPIAKHMR